jgi:hypothetical protein
MKITYHEADDILVIRFGDDTVVRDTSFDWNFNVGYSENGIVEITILDARNAGYWPINVEVLANLAA